MFQTPKGMRDFLPEDMFIRDEVIKRIKDVFKLYGFSPLGTPAIESGKLLVAKGGDAIRNEIYVFEDKGGRELGMRFDLTVPMCRVVASNPNLVKPFKRYAVGMVWRYENPQAGRFREFCQCDADIVGVKSIEADIECVELADLALRELGFSNYTIKLNNRKILSEIVKKMGVEDKKDGVLIAVDKLEKIGVEGVREELEKLGVSKEKTAEILEVAGMKGGLEIIEPLKKILGDCAGIDELVTLANGLEHLGNVELDIGMVRGLAYYTGSIFEIKSDENIGTITAGGRYDKLIGQFGGLETPAVGISFGIERIIEVMKRKEMITKEKTKTKVLVISVTDSVKNEAKKIARSLRAAGIATENDLLSRKLSKNMDYANKLSIPFVAIVGQKEVDDGLLTLKNMKTGEQSKVRLVEAVKLINA